MLEMFMAICALTMLECNDITVEYYAMPKENWHGVAAIDENGNYYIFINENIKKKKEKFKMQLLVHEIAHLVVYDLDPSNTSHYGLYEEVCAELKELTGVGGRYTCEPYSKPPHYPWNTRRRGD